MEQAVLIFNPPHRPNPPPPPLHGPGPMTFSCLVATSGTSQSLVNPPPATPKALLLQYKTGQPSPVTMLTSGLGEKKNLPQSTQPCFLGVGPPPPGPCWPTFDHPHLPRRGNGPPLIPWAVPAFETYGPRLPAITFAEPPAVIVTVPPAAAGVLCHVLVLLPFSLGWCLRFGRDGWGGLTAVLRSFGACPG